jgi:hypothetical protein
VLFTRPEASSGGYKSRLKGLARRRQILERESCAGIFCFLSPQSFSRLPLIFLTRRTLHLYPTMPPGRSSYPPRSAKKEEFIAFLGLNDVDHSHKLIYRRMLVRRTLFFSSTFLFTPISDSLISDCCWS